jgi:hypothetical protein
MRWPVAAVSSDDNVRHIQSVASTEPRALPAVLPVGGIAMVGFDGHRLIAVVQINGLDVGNRPTAACPPALDQTTSVSATQVVFDLCCYLSKSLSMPPTK